jgi:tRNA1Val (adenine37-N6)-methyltransferase
MANTYFEFKQFRINQDSCAMKVGTDGVLIGAWASVEKAMRMLDVGTGTGLISLMLAQRNKHAQIKAVEIDENAAKQASENFKESPWGDRIELLNIPIQKAGNEEKFDLIVSNPPFFIESQKAPDKQRTTARHTDTLSFKDLLEAVKNLLNTNGRFAVVYPHAEGELFAQEAKKQGLFLNRICKVYPTPTKPVRRLLMEFSFQETELLEEEMILEMGKRHDYSKEYIALTKDFYLKF